MALVSASFLSCLGPPLCSIWSSSCLSCVIADLLSCAGLVSLPKAWLYQNFCWQNNDSSLQLLKRSLVWSQMSFQTVFHNLLSFHTLSSHTLPMFSSQEVLLNENSHSYSFNYSSRSISSYNNDSCRSSIIYYMLVTSLHGWAHLIFMMTLWNDYYHHLHSEG